MLSVLTHMHTNFCTMTAGFFTLPAMLHMSMFAAFIGAAAANVGT
jgi:hypothetical protein